jgi:surface protein
LVADGICHNYSQTERKTLYDNVIFEGTVSFMFETSTLAAFRDFPSRQSHLVRHMGVYYEKTKIDDLSSPEWNKKNIAVLLQDGNEHVMTVYASVTHTRVPGMVHYVGYWSTSSNIVYSSRTCTCQLFVDTSDSNAPESNAPKCPSNTLPPTSLSTSPPSLSPAQNSGVGVQDAGSGDAQESGSGAEDAGSGDVQESADPLVAVSNASELNILIKRLCDNGISNITFLNVTVVTDFSMLFSKNCKAFSGDLSKWDMSSATNIQGMFFNTNFNGNVANWDVRKVTTMASTFMMSAFDNDISRWNTMSVTNFDYMFTGPNEFTGDVSRWDTSSATSMTCMFCDASRFNSDISGWNVGRVKDMSNMFYGSTSFNSAVSTWDTGQVRDMNFMFNFASEFSQSVTFSFPTKGFTSKIESMFRGTNLTDRQKNETARALISQGLQYTQW